MRSAAAFAALLGGALAVPLVPVHPKGAASIIVTKENTLNATHPPPKKGTAPVPQATQQLPFIFTNHLGNGMNAYVTGLNTQGSLVFVQPNGQFYYPTCNPNTGVPQPINGNIAIPLGGQNSNTQVSLPDYVSSGRVYFSQGALKFYTVCTGNGNPGLVQPSSANPSDPNANTNWSFGEFTNNNGGLFADISYVDLVGLPLGISMVAGDGSTQSANGLPANAVSTLCSKLANQAKTDGQPWGNLCRNGQPIRAISPQQYISGQSSAFSNYYTNYVNSVWSHYTNDVLTINTQTSSGNVNCQVSNNMLNCAGDNRGYPMPSANDIFGCSGPAFTFQNGDNGIHYAVVPRLCAAFDRSTFLINGGNVQPGPPASSYYSVAPTNYYSAFIHQLEVDGKGYGYVTSLLFRSFPYDDVTPNGGANQAGVVSDGSPKSVTFIVGGP